ncbi:hypothetical protein JCM10207_006647 [Rhodosporidiobolus poonsookiae]
MPQPMLKLEQFRPSFSDDELDGLKDSLRHAKLPKPTYPSKQEKYGITHEWMVKAIDRWQNGFDWKKHEDAINEVDHYLTTIEDEGEEYKIHFIYHESKDPNAIPLMLLHGWPGSAFDFIDAVKLLRKSTDPSFHLIVPMLPSMGWSSAPPLDKEFHLEDCGRLLDKLMQGLGFGDGYYIQGGDIGSGLGRLLAAHYPSCKAVHFNYIPAPRELPSPNDPRRVGLSEREEHDLARGEEWKVMGKAYGYVHCTRPATIGIVVGSSPVALLAWLGEKFRDWVDISLPLDDLLAICTVWWLRDSFANSIWAYPDLLDTGISHMHTTPANHLPATKPFGFSAYPKELSVMPERWVKETGDKMVFYRQHDKGGHFPPIEVLEAYVQDLKDFVKAVKQ